MFSRYSWQMMGSVNLSKCESCKITETYKYWNEHPCATNKYHFITFLSSHPQIPKKFIQCFKGEELEGWWNLRGPSGNQWRVKIERAQDGTRTFKDGWYVFMQDHDVAPHGTIGHAVFTYAGSSTFDVLVLDKTGCMTESAYYATNSGTNPANMCSSSLHGRPNTNNNNNNNNNGFSHEKPSKRKRCNIDKVELIELD